MTTDQVTPIVYASDGEQDTARPSHISLVRNMSTGRSVLAALGIAGLGALAYTVVRTLFAGGGARESATPAPLAEPASKPAMFDPAVDTDPAPFMAVAVETVEVAVVIDDSASTPEHVPVDLMGTDAPGSRDRAIDAFRPDPTAPVPDAMRDSLRPATGPATGFAGNRGDFASGLSQADGSK
jgi:hypothetical protein